MENSRIEWTDHTFNPWHGCMKVSEGCKNCYAETLDNRWNGGHWGPNSPRKPMSEAYWKKPLQWDAQAAKEGKQAKVFCASMADVFEDHADVVQHRIRLFNLINRTPNLIWQLLTKRPENILTAVPGSWLFNWPDNVWIGTSVENQKAADTRIPYLIRVPAKVRFLSCEPLIGPVEFSNVTNRSDFASQLGKPALDGIHWVIVGGESGPKSRPMHPLWAESILHQCKDAEVPFFFKQWGEWSEGYTASVPLSKSIFFGNDGSIFQGNDIIKRGVAATLMSKVGKKQSGAVLAGKEWKEFPELLRDGKEVKP